MGYSLCLMVDFQNGLFFKKISKEVRDAPSALLSYIRTLEFLGTRERFRKVCTESECFPHFSSNSRVLLQLNNARGKGFLFVL